jgi:hypothetical protein
MLFVEPKGSHRARISRLPENDKKHAISTLRKWMGLNKIFIMLDFIDIDLTQREHATELFRISDFKGAEYSFTTQYIWRNTYKSKLCFYKDFLLFVL